MIFTQCRPLTLQAILLQFVPFMLIAGCLAVVTLLLLMHLSPRLGIWNIVGILLVFYVGSLFAYFRSTNPAQLVDSVMLHYPRVDQYFAGLDPPFARFLPNHWVAESLYWTMRGYPSLALKYTLFTMSIAAISFVGMVLVGRRLFYRSWLSSLTLRRATPEHDSIFRFLSLTRPSRLDPQLSVMVRKEFWQFIREPSQWIHFGVISLLVISFVASVSSLKFETPLPFYLTASYMTLLIFNAFLIASVALRFVFPMISVEGPSFWAMLSAPVRRARIYKVKLGIALLPLGVISVTLAVLSHWSITHYRVLPWVASILMMSVAATLVSLNLTSGAYFSDFREKNPIKVASSQSATLTFLVSILYLTILVAVLFVPMNLYFIFAVKGGEYHAETLWFATGAFVLVSLAMTMISIAVGLRTLKRDF